ncbi:hypothetical protein CEXT_780481 [Caerostris extrusa]|uniref:Uncharacterized protein n=1 Tax=Caerostris extrusa TaxID=172846 RepID=A0AAV4WSR5_CAEEX|nr:hypothetical protein CEXT_780481 [Caerostris extrusa]
MIIRIHSDDRKFLFHQQTGSALLEPVPDSISRRETIAPQTRNPISENRGKSKKTGSVLRELVLIRLVAEQQSLHRHVIQFSEDRGKSKMNGTELLELVPDSMSRRATSRSTDT